MNPAAVEGKTGTLRLLMLNPYPIHHFRSTANLVRFTNLVRKFAGFPGVEPILLTGGGGFGGGWGDFDGVPHYRLPSPARSTGLLGLLVFMIVSPLYAVKLFGSLHPHLVYVSESYCAPAVLALRAAFGRRARVTYDVMGLNARQAKLGSGPVRSVLFSLVYLVLDGLIFRCAALVTTINRAHRDILEAYLRRPVPVARDGIDPGLFAPREAGPAAGGDSVVMIFTGKLAHRRLDVLFSALPDLLGRCRSLSVRIVGGGPDAERCRRLARQIDPDGSRLVIRDPVDPGQIPHLLAAADIAYSDDWSKIGFPLKVYEYMAAGLPVVAEGTQAVREVLDHGRTALLYRDRESLIEAVEKLVADPGLRRRLGRAAAAEARESYTWTATAICLLKEYRKTAKMFLNRY